MRARIVLLGIALLALGFAFGCGAKYDLPTEHILGRGVPGDGSYQMVATWHGMTGVQDVLLTPGTGAQSQLFVLLNPGGPAAASGQALDYFLSRPKPVGTFVQNGLLNPAALCVGGDESGGAHNRIYVLERGDTLGAKTLFTLCDSTSHPPCADPVQRRYITSLARYWHLREYTLLGALVSDFSDTSMAFVTGVAADDDGSVYVSGTAVVNSQSSTSQFLFVRTFVSKVFKYRRGQRYPGVLPADPNIPVANWHRDTTYSHTQGAGVGYVSDPYGLAWSAYPPQGLYVADRGNNSGQKLSDSDTTGFFRYEQDGNGVSLSAPQGVAVDASGFVYVCDTGNRRVLRFDAGGGFVQRVDIEPDDTGAPLLNPVGIAVNDSIVYVADAGRGEIVRYQRRK